MIKNLIKIALRNLQKDKSYSLLNILGLTIGITCSLFLIFYVMDELGYDRYHKNAQQIYRVGANVNEPEKAMQWANTQFLLAPALKTGYPEIEQAVRLVAEDKVMYKKGTDKFYENKIFYADSNYFEIFTADFLAGTAAGALINPNSIVLTQTLAQKYYGNNERALGQVFENNRGDKYTVTAIVKDVPENSHLIYNALISMNTLPRDFANFWGQFGNFFTYVKLNPNVTASAVEKKMLSMYDKYMAEIFTKFNVKINYSLQPLTAIHLHSARENEPEELGSMSYIYIFSIVAFFMLVIASINYMNLTTARSARRAKEIGIRKVVGSLKSQLVWQFLTESVTTTLFSLVLSVAAFVLLLPFFNSIAGKLLTVNNLLQPVTLYVLLGILFFVGLLGGSYPAFYLTKFNPLAVLKGSLAKASSNILLRRVLVVTQFTISIVMLICTWVVYDQLHFMSKKDLGFNQQQVLSLRTDPGSTAPGKMKILKNEIVNLPGIISTSVSETTPGDGATFNLYAVETNTGFVDKGIDVYSIDEDYIKTLGMKIATGRNFASDNPADTINSVIVNEAMVKTFAWANAIGKKIKRPGDTSGRYLEVVGVVKDFHQKSLYNPLAPLMLLYNPNSFQLQAKISATDIASTIAAVEKKWKTVFADIPFQYDFLDKRFQSQYVADEKRAKIFTTFSVLTILISCLGLLGLVAFTTQQRKKEISIRKIMGAEVANIIPMIAKNFILLVFISCLIAFPVAYFFMNRWLQVFPYKTDLKTSTFLLSALVVMAITLLTVSFHSVKAAITNPVKNLSAE
jgi:putative ABC transport system permease protein